MRNTNINTGMRKGFTMVELIFVIVIIGILAAVAIPKLAANKDDAIASTCVHEVGQYLSEYSQAYAAKKDYNTWKEDYNADENITNINFEVVDGNGFSTDKLTSVVDEDIEYLCDGEKLVNIKGTLNSSTGVYSVKVDIEANPASPAVIKAAVKLNKSYGGASKTFRL